MFGDISKAQYFVAHILSTSIDRTQHAVLSSAWIHQSVVTCYKHLPLYPAWSQELRSQIPDSHTCCSRSASAPSAWCCTVATHEISWKWLHALWYSWLSTKAGRMGSIPGRVTLKRTQPMLGSWVGCVAEPNVVGRYNSTGIPTS